MKFDYLIIGAGTAGCVLANRLSEDPKNNVAIFEAGKNSDIWKVNMPLALLVAIARAIINDPEIILADEPTGSLDLNTAKEIFELLNNQKKPNRLIIFATHNRFFANKADCLLEITDGSVKTINV